MIVPKKHLGQNFLKDKNIVIKIVESFSPAADDSIIEIGPGEGALTSHLFQKNKKLIAIELDERAVAGLNSLYPDLKVINSDFLKMDISTLPISPKLRVIGNIPYYITTPILFKLIEHRDIISDIMLMVQYEVAERITASPGTKNYGILSVLCNYFCETKLLFKVSRNVFFPKPNVDSAVISLNFLTDRPLTISQENLFRKIVRIAFNQRRKMLRNSLGDLISSDNQKKIELDFTLRAENLSVADYIKLTGQLDALSGKN